MNQSAASQPSRKKAVLSLLILLVLTGVIVLIFRDHWAEITAALAQLNLWQVLVVLALGISYPLLEGCVSTSSCGGGCPASPCGRASTTPGAALLAMWSCWAPVPCRCRPGTCIRPGCPLAPGVGLMTLQYVFHKTTVLLYATVMLLFQHKWLAANTTGVLKYLPMAYVVVALVIVALVLVCVSPLVQNLARWALGFCPRPKNGSSAGLPG